MKFIHIRHFQIKASFFFLTISLLGASCTAHKKIDYGSKYVFDNYILDRTSGTSWHTSELLFYGQIKSVKLTSFDEEDSITSVVKKFFTKEKEDLCKLGYDKNMNITSETRVYSKTPYGVGSILKSGFGKNMTGKYQITSEHDIINRMIVVKRIENNQINQIDSISYIGNFYPTHIRKYERYKNVYKLERTERYIFQGDKILLHLSEAPNWTKVGSKHIFDNDGRYIYSYDIKNFDIENLTYELGEIDSTLWPRYTWSATGYEVVNSYSTSIFNFENKTKIKQGDNYVSTEFFSEDLRPLKREYRDKSSEKITEIVEYTYNKQKDLTLERETTYRRTTNNVTNRIYEYEYDKKGNWVERKLYFNQVYRGNYSEEYRGKETREIEYY